MSAENVSRFFDKLEKDRSLNEAYKDAIQTALTAFAASRGFEFTAKDLQKCAAEKAAELTDGDLEGVAGGFGSFNLGASARPEKVGFKKGALRGWDPDDIG